MDLNHRSCIDHFLVDMNIFHAVLCSYVVESVDNHSHHHPIRLKAKLNINLNTSVARKHNSNENFIDWSKVNDEQIYNYEYLLDNSLSQIDIEDAPLHCKDLFCTSESHKAFINKMCHKLINCCLEAGKNSFPTKSCISQKSKPLPFWKEEVKPFRDKSLFWHSVWTSCGRPKMALCII